MAGMDNIEDIKKSIQVATKNIRKKLPEEIEQLACAWMKKTGLGPHNSEIFVQQVPGFRGLRISFQKIADEPEIENEEFARSLENTFEHIYNFEKSHRKLETKQDEYKLNGDIENKIAEVAALLNEDARHYILVMAHKIEELQNENRA